MRSGFLASEFLIYLVSSSVNTKNKRNFGAPLHVKVKNSFSVLVGAAQECMLLGLPKEILILSKPALQKHIKNAISPASKKSANSS
jgi:hypothetical protein